MNSEENSLSGIVLMRDDLVGPLDQVVGTKRKSGRGGTNVQGNLSVVHCIARRGKVPQVGWIYGPRAAALGAFTKIKESIERRISKTDGKCCDRCERHCGRDEKLLGRRRRCFLSRSHQDAKPNSLIIKDKTAR